MLVDEVRLGLDVHTIRTKVIDSGMEVIDLEVEERWWRADIEEQPGASKVEEQQSRRVEASGGRLPRACAALLSDLG